MKFHSFFVLAGASFASLPLRPAFALAQESPPSFEYLAPTPDCVSNDAFQALVKAEIARFPSSDRAHRLSVRIVQQDGLYAGTLTTETGAVRTVTAARCDDVTAALAVIIAVAEPSGAAPADTPSPPVTQGFGSRAESILAGGTATAHARGNDDASPAPEAGAATVAPAIAVQLEPIRRARALVAAGDAPAALVELDAYETLYPHGTFEEEAIALRVRALRMTEDAAGAERERTNLRSRFPKSVHLAALGN